MVVELALRLWIRRKTSDRVSAALDGFGLLGLVVCLEVLFREGELRIERTEEKTCQDQQGRQLHCELLVKTVFAGRVESSQDGGT